MYQHKLFYGIAFALVLGGLAVLIIRPFVRRREKEAYRDDVVGNWPKVTKLRKSDKKHDPPLHVDANTMPLGLAKMIKTGTDCDKGVMS